MFKFVRELFDTTDFQSRWGGENWSDIHGWTHIVADITIFCTYAAMACVLAYFARRRPDVPFLPIFWLLAAFLLLRGSVHLMNATLFWHPWYRFSGLVKVLTALVSVGMVIGLLRIVPKALALPGLATINQRLEAEIAERKRTQEVIARYAADLERSNRDLDQFAYSASHDLKAPLRAVDNLARWIAEDAGRLLPETSRRDLALMRERIGRMQRLLDDLLAYARAGRIQHQREAVDTAVLVRDVVAWFAPPAGFTVTSADLPTLATYKAPLEQVFRNLPSNITTAKMAK
ncbi:MAG TPA: histidine kinase dimerization/phospho-acceptor domain-containing protein [Pirellulales bacterium]|nr:histidine kinase dimerization/phospho-acceptor domain-containing protein [Pirellulales bacterium]